MTATPAQLRKIRILLKTLTLLHVGGSEGELPPTEFAHCNGKVYVLSADRWAAWLGRQKAVEEFVNYIETQGKYASLQSYLGQQDLLKPEFLTPLAKYTAESASVPRTLRAFIRNGYSEPYLPGSAIKGALRVAILYAILQKLTPAQRDELLAKQIEQGLERFQAEWKNQETRWRSRIADRERLQRKLHGVKRGLQERTKKFFAGDLDKQLLQNFKLSDQQREHDAHSDLFRVIEVQDGKPFERDGLQVEEIKVHSVGSGVKSFSIYAECLPPNREFTVEITINLYLLSLFKRNNPKTAQGLAFEEIEALLLNPWQAAQKLAQALYEHERAFLPKEMNVSGALDFAEEPDIRLGWGGGMLGTTVDLLLDEKLRQRIRNLLFKDRDGAPAPKTRRLTLQNQQPLGWCTILSQEVH